jgi:predicted nuclease of restriction endonuclease-like (RecB) superfamily
MVKRISLKPPAAKRGIDMEQQFSEVASIVNRGRARAASAFSVVVIDTYWMVGEYISRKVKKAEWGDGVVKQLAGYLQKRLVNPRGFSDKNLWRMMQFHDLYAGCKKVSALLRELSWTNNLLIMSKCRSMPEREFYLRLAAAEQYSSRMLEHAIDTRMFQRSVSKPAKLSAALRETKTRLVRCRAMYR